jgi:hypothetical protein
MNELQQQNKPEFDFALVSAEQAVALQTISTRLAVRVQRTAEEMIAMGADLAEAKRVCKEDDELFTTWCESEECPVNYKTAQRLVKVYEQMVTEKAPGGLFSSQTLTSIGTRVFSEVIQTRDDDIRQALIEHIETTAEEGGKVSKREVEALKKALNEAQKKAKELESESFDAKASLARIKAERDEIAKREIDATAKKNEYSRMLIEEEKRRRGIEKQHQQELADAEEVHRMHLNEMRAKYIEEAKKLPRSDEEEAARQAKLKELEREQARIHIEINNATKERDKLARELADSEKQFALSERVFSDWSTAAISYRETAIRLMSSAKSLRKVPMTDELYNQVKMMRELTAELTAKLDEVTHVA